MDILLSIFIVFGLNSMTSAIVLSDLHLGSISFCYTNYNCDVGECCRSFNKTREEIFNQSQTHMHIHPLWNDWLPPVYGICEKIGTEGERCIVDEVETGIKDLYYDCPCATGLVCNGTGTDVIDRGELGVCVPEEILKTTLNQSCASGDDCADSECCVSNDRPIGEQSLHGHCSSMGNVGSECPVEMGSGKPNDTVLSCPCLSGLKCNGTGMDEMDDVPLDELGKCVTA